MKKRQTVIFQKTPGPARFPVRFLSSYIAIYFLIRVSIYLVIWSFADYSLIDIAKDAKLFRSLLDTQTDMMRSATLILAGLYAAGYALYETTRNDPLRHKIYFDWLRQTPWQPGQPLPLGKFGPRPIHFLYMMFLALPIYIHVPVWFLAPAVPIMAYALVFMVLQFLTLVPRKRYKTLFTFFFLAGTLFYSPILLYTVPALFIGGFIWLCLDQKLALRDEWNNPQIKPPTIHDIEADDEIFIADQGKDEHEESRHALKNQFLQMPPEDLKELSAAWVIARSLLFAWYVLGLCYATEKSESLNSGEPTDWVLFYAACLGIPAIMVVIRWGRFAGMGGPPLPLFARYANNVWIIPRYDRIYIAPAIMLLIAISTIPAGLILGVNKLYYLPPTALAISLVMGFCPPSLLHHKLTGHHQM